MGLLPDPRTTVEDLVLGRRDWRVVLERDYAPTARRLQQAYARTAERLRPLAGELDAHLADIYAATGRLTPADVRGANQYARLLARVEGELNDFAAIARNDVADLAERAIGTGADAALDLTLGAAGDLAPAVQGAWVRPDPGALRRLIGYVEGDAFRGRWAAFGENAARNLGDLYLTGIAQGKNPRALARMARAWFGVPYAWAENSARTAQVWSYRTANHAAFAANDRIVEGWIWRSARGPRTCPSCWAQDGTVHPVTDVLNDHHSGRCVPVPIVRGVPYNTSQGRDVFAQLSEDEQRTIMGPGLWDAWKRGDARWEDLSVRYSDPIYGDMLRTPSLKALGVQTA